MGKPRVSKMALAVAGILVVVWPIIENGLTPAGILTAMVSAVLVKISLIDMKTMLIPDKLLFLMAGLALLSCGPDTEEPGLISRLTGIFAVSLPMTLLNCAVPESFGGGDIKLMAICGFLLGLKLVALAAFLAVLTGGLFAIYLLVSAGMTRKEHFAFAPFLSFGIWMSMLYGEKLILWYQRLI